MKNGMIGILVLAAPAAAQQVDPDGTTYEQLPTCVDALRDQATGDCVGVSSTPTLGMLLPLGPNINFDQFGQLRLGQTVHVDGAVIANATVAAVALCADGGDLTVINGGRAGIGEAFPEADLHIENRESAEIIIEADWDNSGELDHPRVSFWQDGGAVQSFVGFQDGLNDFSLRNQYSGGGMRFDLHTSSTRDWEFRRRASAGTDVEARLTQSGNLQLDGSVSSPAADLAEFYPVAGAVEPGDVVAFSGDGLTLERARSGVAGRLAGVVSSRPAFAMGLSYTVEEELGLELEASPGDEPIPASTSELEIDPTVAHEIDVNRRAPLALTGRIPCKVSDENGPIAPGDLLTVASLPGHAMKATEAGAVIGTALEAWNGGEGTILVLANLGWFSPTADLERRMAELETEVRELVRELARERRR